MDDWCQVPLEILHWIDTNKWGFGIATSVLGGIVLLAVPALRRQLTNTWRVVRERSLNCISFVRSLTLTTKSSLYRDTGTDPAEVPSRAVWVAGSYGDDSTSDQEKKFAGQVARLLGSELAKANITVVVGESDVLYELCNTYRRVSNLHGGARALMVHGSLRHEDPVGFLGSLLVRPPTVLIVIGGQIGGRTIEEARLARQSNVPVAAFIRSGGAATKVLADFAIQDSESSNAVRDCIGWVRRTAPA
ncbi:hypothetical protein [Mycobacterium sp. AT1]|uniref:hypothetical protein n=1 Tax=Mycobacterium sp. AT1 TaxID=1961706 RepID=UPI0009AD59E3|nr:hypothetical protein [Mycobacterium sp. AT1]OPX05535.1 hypothetical protein B1790_31635 [Mycobacterium sp. AT1]